MNKTIENNIINILKEDKEMAFDLIINEYGNMIFNMSLRFLNDRDLSEDLTQEIYIKIWNNLNKFKANSSLFTWVYKIAYNTSINFAKKRKKEIMRINNYINNQKNTANNALIFDIEKALNKLPEKEKMVIILKHINNMSYKEISQIMNKSEKAIEGLLYRAREHLRQILSRGEYGTY